MHPILFRLPLPHFGSVPVYSYGIMLAISLIVGWFLTLGLAARDGLPREAMANCYVDTAIMALVGSRVLYLVTNPSEFTTFSSLFAMRSGGLVAYGGFLGGLLGSYLSLRFGFGITGVVRLVSGRFGGERAKPWRPLPLLPWADVAVPSLASGLFITRIGCYLFGCDFGRPLGETAPAFLKRLGTFPRWADGTMTDGSLGSPAWDRHVRLGLIDDEAASSLPVHPTQIYESLFGLGLLIFLLAMRKHQRFRGEIFLWFAFLYGSGRFILETVRDDTERGNVPPALAPHVLLTISLAALSVAYIVGISPRVAPPFFRMVTWALALVPPLLAFVWLRPGSFETVMPISLSTSQFVGVTSGVLAGAGFWLLFRAAQTHPEHAMRLPDFSDDDTEEPADEADEEAGADEEGGNRASEASDGKQVEEAALPAPADVATEDDAPAKPDPIESLESVVESSKKPKKKKSSTRRTKASE